MADESQVIDLSTLEFPGDPSKLPTSKELSLGDIELEITGWSAVKTKPVNEGDKGYDKGNRGNKLMFKATFKATAPEEIAGLPYTHQIVVGSNADPAAQKESTWASGGGTEVMKILNRAKTHLGATTKPNEAMLASVGQRVIGEVKLEKDKNGVYPDKHIVKNWHKVGDRQPRLAGDGVGSPLRASAPSTPPPVFENNE
jgi:hypothetical protein